jgi:hypothetical protein
VSRPPFAALAAAAVTVAGLVLAVPRVQAGDRSLVWKTISTQHFFVHYYEPLDDVAHRVAVVAERSHRVLAPVLGHEPAEPTHIVLVDDTDGANGFANVLPRNTIRLFATAPSGLSVLNDHDDWMYQLVAHEYTHILHLDTIGGLPAFYNRLLGKTWAPNQIQPRWLIEGLATYQESMHSAGGRTRSALFDMFLRVAVLAGAELDLDALSSGPLAWPHSTSAYLYGSHFLQYVFDVHGADKVAIMSQTYGRSPIPFGVNRQIEAAVGKSFVELYADWRAHMTAKYHAQLEAVERAGRREGRRLTFSGEGNFNPAYTKDGRDIVWRQADGRSRARFRAMPVGGSAAQAMDYADVDRAGAFDLLADGSMIVEQTTIYRTNYDTQDLYRLDRRTGRLEPLTRGLRTRDPAVSPDEAFVAFMHNGAGRSRLAVMPLAPGAPHRVLWRGPGRYDQVTAPAWSPGGYRIAFSAWRSGGYRDILIVDVATGTVTDLMRDRAIDADPVFSPDGRFVYFSSDRTGIYNIYAYELATGALHQVTNVIGCALVPDVSGDSRRLVYQGFAEAGYEIYEIDLEPSQWLQPTLYVDDRPSSTVIPDDEVEVSTPRPYRPLATLAPRAYQVQLSADSFGSALTATTGGSDVAGWHAYSLGATVGFAYGDTSVGGAYHYQRLWPNLRIAAHRTVGRRGGYAIDAVNTAYTESAVGLTARVDLPVLRAEHATSNLAFDYDLDWVRNVDDEFVGHDPNQAVPGYPETDAVNAALGMSWRFGDTRSYHYTLGPQEGHALTASAQLSHPALGSDFHTLTLSYRWNAFYRLPWRQAPVLSLRLAGGLTTTDRRRSGGFVLAGVPEQDIPRAIRESLRAGGTGYLRGYPPRSIAGRQFHLLNVELRQVLVEIERGLETVPIYLRRLHVAALLDAGDAFDGPLAWDALKVAAGASLRLDVVLGFFAAGSFDIGFARGLTSGGKNELWFLLTSTL